MSTGAAVLEMLEIGGLFLGSTLLALVALLVAVRHFQDRAQRAAVTLVVEVPDGPEEGYASSLEGVDPGGAKLGAALAGLQPPAVEAPGDGPAAAASPEAADATVSSPPAPPAGAERAPASPAPAPPAPAPPAPVQTAPTAATADPPAQAAPPAPPPEAAAPAAVQAAPAAPVPAPVQAAPAAPVPAPVQPAPTPPAPASAEPVASPPTPAAAPPPPTTMPRPSRRARARSTAPPPAAAASPPAPTAPSPAPSGRVVLGIDPEREDVPDTPQRHGVTPAEELTEDQLRRLNPRARRAALRKQSQKPLPDLDAIPIDLKQEIVQLLGEGKQIKAFGVFRKRLGVSFKDAEKGVVLVAHEAGLDVG